MVALNRFTLLQLIPHLQRDGHEDKVMGQAESGAEGFFDAVTYVAGFAEVVQQSKNYLVQEIDAATKLLQRRVWLKSQLEQRFSDGKERVELQKQHGDVLARAMEQMETQMGVLKNSCSRAEQLSGLYTNILTDICNMEELVAGKIQKEAERISKNASILKNNCHMMAEIPSHIRSIRSTEAQVLQAGEEAETLRSAMEQRREAWQQLIAEMNIFRTNARVAQEKAKGMGEQAALQVRETKEFLETVVPQEVETQLTQLSKDMEHAADKLKRYAAAIEEQSYQPLLWWQEWVGLGLLGAVVVVKLIFIYV